jgi:hypothetical protein
MIFYEILAYREIERTDFLATDLHRLNTGRKRIKLTVKEKVIGVIAQNAKLKGRAGSTIFLP